MLKKIASLIVLASLLVGCNTAGSLNNETAKLRQEIINTKQDLQNSQDALNESNKELDKTKKQLAELKVQYEEVNKELESYKNSLESTKKQLEMANSNSLLRNQLDLQLYQVIDLLIIGDVRSARKHFVKEADVTKKLVTTYPTKRGVEFVVPEVKMNLRQRNFDAKDNEFSAVYEILDSGYVDETKYNERIYTLNINYVKEKDKWKIKSLFIDE